MFACRSTGLLDEAAMTFFRFDISTEHWQIGASWLRYAG